MFVLDNELYSYLKSEANDHFVIKDGKTYIPIRRGPLVKKADSNHKYKQIVAYVVINQPLIDEDGVYWVTNLWKRLKPFSEHIKHKALVLSYVNGCLECRSTGAFLSCAVVKREETDRNVEDISAEFNDRTLAFVLHSSSILFKSFKFAKDKGEFNLARFNDDGYVYTGFGGDYTTTTTMPLGKTYGRFDFYSKLDALCVIKKGFYQVKPSKNNVWFSNTSVSYVMQKFQI
ncbi:TPA: hypothetical protein NG565_001779 [Vibrio parahaemolyticus]|nr:hypothetical protein [Vibrio parahaemolyticus]